MKFFLLILVYTGVVFADVKPIFIMVYDNSCSACKRTILLINNNKNLNSAILNYTKPFQMSVNEAAENNLLVRSVPTFFLLDPKTSKMLVRPLEGEIVDPNDFARFLKQVYRSLN